MNPVQITGAPEDISIIDLLAKGGPIMIPIALLSVLTIYFLVERWMYINSVSKRSPELIDSVADHLEKGNVNGAMMSVQRENSATGKMIYPALSFVGKSYREMEAVMEANAEIQIGRMEKNLGYLGVIAGIAPMLGFIGTISGIIKIFYNISASNDISIGIIAGGLYEKMITSGAGLFVGAIAFTCYHILNLRIQRITLALQEDASNFLIRINGQLK
ncbi:MAG TPA: MotA/TolQ/ExbB proton channel family protein [Cyclobacteriaceae bacterium]